MNVGVVEALWRYPVKSMLGEPLDSVEIGEYGLAGDRAYALVDQADGKVVTAKNPKRWPRMFQFSAQFPQPYKENGRPSPVCITLPDGTRISSDAAEADRVLSEAMAATVRLETVTDRRQSRVGSISEGYWPDVEWLDDSDSTGDFSLAEGTFFDGGIIHLVTTATLGRLSALHPGARFDVRRFRPNVVIQSPPEQVPFAEQAWIGSTISIGKVQMKVVKVTSRCVMTTLPQTELGRDLNILRTIATENSAKLGVYASVVRPGTVDLDDAVLVVGA